MTKGANRAWPSQPPACTPVSAQCCPRCSSSCIVGGIGTVIDLGGAAVLHSKYHVGPLAAKAVSVTLATRVHLPGLPVLDVQGAGEPVGAARGRAVLRAQRGGPAHRGGRDRPRDLRHGAARPARVQRGRASRHRPRHDLPVLRLPQVGVPRARDGVRSRAWRPTRPAFPDYPPWELDPSFLPSDGRRACSPRRCRPRPPLGSAPRPRPHGTSTPPRQHGASTRPRLRGSSPPATGPPAPAGNRSPRPGLRPRRPGMPPRPAWEPAEYGQRRTDNAIIPNGRLGAPHRTAPPRPGRTDGGRGRPAQWPPA